MLLRYLLMLLPSTGEDATFLIFVAVVDCFCLLGDNGVEEEEYYCGKKKLVVAAVAAVATCVLDVDDNNDRCHCCGCSSLFPFVLILLYKYNWMEGFSYSLLPTI